MSDHSTTIRELAAARYVSFVSFRRNGTPVATPVWIAPYGQDELCFTTSGDAAKVKRLANDSRASIQPCDVRGRLKPGTMAVEVTARVTTGTEFDEVEAAVAHKYRIQYRLVVWSGSIRERFRRQKTADCGVIMNISLGRPEPSLNDD
jgi:PPOX class probable F420-dependent enzyme